MAQGFKVGLDQDSIKKALEQFKDVLGDLNKIASGNKITFGLDDAVNVIDVFINRLKSAEKQIKKMDDVKNGTSFKNGFINTQGFDVLEQRVNQIRDTVDSLAKYKFRLDKEGNIEKALITYRDGLGKVVEETMQWKMHQEEVNGIIEKTNTFETDHYDYTDDMNKKVQAIGNIDKLSKDIQVRFERLQGKYASIFNSPEYKQSVTDSVNFLKGKIDATKLDPRTFDKNDFNNQWKEIAQSVKQYNSEVHTGMKRQDDLYNNISDNQEEIYRLQTRNLTADSAIRARNDEKILALTKQKDEMVEQLRTMESQVRVAKYLTDIEENNVELRKDYDAKAKSVADKANNKSDDKGALNEVLTIQKQINSLELKNLTVEDAIKKRNEEKINILKQQLIESEKLKLSDKERQKISDQKNELDKDLIAKETSVKQVDNYTKVKNILNTIHQLRTQMTNLGIQENDENSELVKKLNEQRELVLLISQGKIKLSDGTKAEALNAEQIKDIEEVRLLNLKEIERLQAKIADKNAYAKKSSGGGKSPDVFGEKQDTSLTFNSAREDLEDFIKANFNDVGKFGAFNNSIEKSGQLVKQLDYYAKSADGTMHKYRLTIDAVTNSTRIADLGTRNLSNANSGLVANLGKAISKLGEWILASGAVYAVFNQFKNGFNFVNDLNKALTEIGIVTYQSQGQVAKYAEAYNTLAKEMRVTTGEIAKASVEFYRQGLSQSEVMERMRATTQFAKISNLEFAESAKVLTATVNSMGVDIQRATDVFAYLGDATATGADEVAKAFSIVGGTSNALNVSFEKVSAYIASLSSKTREGSEQVGNSIKSIMLRYQQLRQNGFAEEDGTKVNAVAKALNEVNIKIIDTEGNFRNFSDVMDELGLKWDGLSSREKAYISTQMAGRMLPVCVVICIKKLAISEKLLSI